MKITKTERLAFALITAMQTEQADTIARIVTEADRLSSIKGDAAKLKDAANDEAGSLWDDVRNLAEAVYEGGGELELKAVQAVFTALVVDALEGKEAALKTVKAYTSTGRACIKAVTSGTVKGWPVLKAAMIVGGEEGEEAVSYADVRQLIKSSGQREVDAAKAELVKMIGEIAGKESSVRSSATRLAAITAIMELVRPERDAAVRLQDEAKPASKAAKAATAVRQQQPSAPMVTEVSRAA